MEMILSKKRHFDDQDIELVCRQKTFPPSNGHKEGILSVLEQNFLAIPMLFHVTLKTWKGNLLISFLFHLFSLYKDVHHIIDSSKHSASVVHFYSRFFELCKYGYTLLIIE